MKDLKNIIFYEQLLSETNNGLIRQEQESGKYAFGYTCYHMPEVLLNLGNCFSVRLRAPNTSSLDLSTYYMSNFTCEYARGLLERAIEGGYNFLDSIAGLDACETMNRCMENIEIQNLIKKPKFFISHVDVPLNDDEDCVAFYQEQIERKLLKQLEDNFSIDISDTSIRQAVKKYNAICDVVTKIGEYRKLENPTITGYEFSLITLASYCCPWDLILPYLNETLDDLKTRQPDEKPSYRAKLVVVGGEIDEPELIQMIEDAGGLVVADRYCYGSLPGRQPYVLNDKEPALTQILRQQLQRSMCPRLMSKHKVKDRHEYVKGLVSEYSADGIIYEQIKFCVPWGYERTLASYVQEHENNIPCLSIDRPYVSHNSGQLRTRFQAFVESVELKKINDRIKEKN